MRETKAPPIRPPALFPYLIPDMPPADDLLPLLRSIDANRSYTNFGPLSRRLEAELEGLLEGLEPAEQGRAGAGAGAVAVTTTSSGTAALELALRALSLPDGARILIPSLTFPATMAAALAVGGRPVLTDVDEGSWVLTAAIAREAARRFSLAAVIPVATFGFPLEVEEWEAFSRDTGVAVVIDAAAALGNQRIPGEGISVAFSLHATKPFGAGEGGFLASRDGALIGRARRLSNFGFQGETVVCAGTNAKMSEYAAAGALTQLARRGELTAWRWSLWRAYHDALTAAGVTFVTQPFADGSIIPCLTAGFPRIGGEAAGEALRQAGIASRRWYLPPLHEHPPFRSMTRSGPDGGDELPTTGRLKRLLLGLPFHREVPERLLEVAAAVAGAHGLDGRGAAGGLRDMLFPPSEIMRT